MAKHKLNYTSFMTAGEDRYAFLAPDPELPRGSLVTHVADQLRRAILAMDFPPGAMIDKSQVCVRLGVSRSPVVAAFARLEAEGLVEIIPQRGTMVTFVSFDAVCEYIFIRKALEGETVRTLAETRSPELLDALQANIDLQNHSAQAQDKEQFHTLDLQFHERLTTALDFRRLKALVDNTRSNIDRVRQMTNSMRRIREGIAEHTDILAALRERDGERAMAVMHAHLDGIITEMKGLRHEHPDLFGTPRRFSVIREP